MGKHIDLIQMLNTNGSAVVEFTKMDGSKRLMRCVWGENGEVEDTYSVVYDVEAEGYRRIRHNSILRVG